MTKPVRGGLSLVRLVEDAPLEALIRFLDTDLGPLAMEVPASHSAGGDAAAEFREVLRRRVQELSDAPARRLADEAGRILVMSAEGAQRLDRTVAACLDAGARAEYEAQADALGRSIWTFLEARRAFDDAESYHHAARCRGHGKPYDAFEAEVAGGPFEWTDDLQAKLSERITAALGLKESCSISHLLVDENGSAAPLHVIIVRHAGPLSSVAEHRQDGQKNRHYFRPPNEATLFYSPGSATVEICAETISVRQDIAVCFAEAGLGQNLSNRSLTFRNYDLAPLQRSLRLPQVEPEGFSVSRAAVTEVDLRPGDPRHRISLKVTFDDDVEDLAQGYLGSSDNLRRRTVTRVGIGARFRRTGDRREKSLNFAVSYPNRCTLRGEVDPGKRDLGFALLRTWGILKSSRTMTAEEKRALLPTLLDLFEFKEEQVLECDLAAQGFDVEQLIEWQLIEPRGRLAKLVIDDVGGDELVETSDGIAPEVVEFEDASGRPAWAPSALVRKLAINRPWIEELIVKQLVPHLITKTILRRQAHLMFLGEIAVGDESCSCYLADRLDDYDVLPDVDLFLRGESSARTELVLTTSRRAPHCLGPHVVAKLHEHLAFDASDTCGPVVSLAALAATYHHGRLRALGGSSVELVKNDFGGATLRIPGKAELHVSGAKQIPILERLVAAHRSRSPIVPTKALMEGTASNSPEQAFGKRWHIARQYVERVGVRSGWRLLV